MSYTYKIEYELTERLTDDQLVAMQAILGKPWVPPPGYSGQVIKAGISREVCDTIGCRDCWQCQPVRDGS